jgi:hypothetical protein
MERGRSRFGAARRVVLPAALALAAGALPAQEPARAVLTDAQRERFLLQARILSRHELKQGGIGTERATLSLDGVEHEALVQEIEGYDLKVEMTDDTEMGLRDNWRGNVAAYRLDRLLGLRMVPVTVERRDDLKEASFAWWVDDILDEPSRLKTKIASPDVEAWDRQMDAVRIFDQLIHNLDRKNGTLLVDKDWHIWMNGHSRAFKGIQKLRSPKSLGARCPRGLLAALRRLDKSTVERSMVGLLDGPQIDGLLARRDAIVHYFEERIASSGEDAVLYDLPTRP